MMNAIEVYNLTQLYGERKVLDDISFKVKEHSIHGFLGPNGAGKTTTMRIITKLLNPSMGHIQFNNNGHEVLEQHFYQHIGFLLDELPLYKDMRVIEYLKFVAKLKKVPSSQIEDNINYAIDALDLSAVVNRSIENLSKGYKQRVGVAQAIVHKPKILILDEPTLGLDPHSVIEMRNLILNLKSHHTILISSHLLHEMSLICDEITIISKGRILKSGSMELMRDELEKKQELRLVFRKTTSAFYDYLNELDVFESIQTEEHEDGIMLVLKPKSNIDLRSDLIKKSVELSSDLLELHKKEFSLEDLFLEVTESHD